jgi:ABC-type transport system involved in multi-copper enzyme maturation permease subunit
LNSTAIEPAAARRSATPPEPRPSFLGSVRGEALKLSRQGLVWAMLGLAVVFYLMVTAALSQAAPFKQTLQRSPATFLSDLYDIYQTVFDTGSGIVLLILSARLVGMEYSGGTIRVLLARGAGRLRLLVAKLTALALLGVLLLAGFLAMTAVAVALLLAAWNGTLPAHPWADLPVAVLIALVSTAAAILVGSTAAVVGRSLAFAIAAALAFYPLDNFLVVVLRLVNALTGQRVWLDLSGFLLGPNVSNLPAVLETDRAARVAFATPLVTVDATHAWLVIGAWCAALGTLSVVLTRRRDVLQ